jgi:hypothetical protein
MTLLRRVIVVHPPLALANSSGAPRLAQCGVVQLMELVDGKRLKAPSTGASKPLPKSTASSQTVDETAIKHEWKGIPRRLPEHICDWIVMAALLACVKSYSCWLIYRNSLPKHVAEPEELTEEELAEREEMYGYIDAQVSVVIMLMLIGATVFFELLKHWLQTSTPPMYTAVLHAFFGEFTVVGFLALYTYFLLRTGILEHFSMQLYGEEMRLVELFEDLHFLLFFVMLAFLAEALILLSATHRAETGWRHTQEDMMWHLKLSGAKADEPGATSQPVLEYLAATMEKHAAACGPMTRLVWSYRVDEGRASAIYALARDRFIHEPKASGGLVMALPADFDLSACTVAGSSRSVTLAPVRSDSHSVARVPLRLPNRTLCAPLPLRTLHAVFALCSRRSQTCGAAVPSKWRA